jgi:hypothetical protein
MFPTVPTSPPQDSRKKPPPETEAIDLPPVDVARRRHPGSEFQRIALTELESLRRAEFMPIASGARDALQDAADRKRAAKRERQLNRLRMGGDTEMDDDDTFDGINRVLNDYSEIATEYASLQQQLGFDSLDGSAAPVLTSDRPLPTVAERPPVLPDEDDADELLGNDSLTASALSEMSFGSESNSDLN